jgi:hypothetical protein
MVINFRLDAAMREYESTVAKEYG